MDLNKHIVKTDNNKPIHSSGLAQAAQGDRMGAAAPISFNQRQQLERNRQIVAGYHRSKVGSTYTEERRSMINRSGLRRSDDQIVKSSLQQHNSVKPLNVNNSFREPPSRSYNPYA